MEWWTDKENFWLTLIQVNNKSISILTYKTLAYHAYSTDLHLKNNVAVFDWVSWAGIKKYQGLNSIVFLFFVKEIICKMVNHSSR